MDMGSLVLRNATITVRTSSRAGREVHALTTGKFLSAGTFVASCFITQPLNFCFTSTSAIRNQLNKKTTNPATYAHPDPV